MAGNVYPEEIRESFSGLSENKPINLDRINDLIAEVTNHHTVMNIKITIRRLGFKQVPLVTHYIRNVPSRISENVISALSVLGLGLISKLYNTVISGA